MRLSSAVLVVALLAACAPSEEPPEEAPPAAAEPAPPVPTLADFAGTWQISATLDGTATPVESTLTGTAAGGDWTLSLEGRPNIPVEVSIVGDSLITQTAEYESVLRPGVMVRTRLASVLQGGMLMGNVLATYTTAAGEEVVPGTSHGMRVP